MKKQQLRPGQVRDTIIDILMQRGRPMSSRELETEVCERLNTDARSSVRSYLRLNTPETFIREARGVYRLRMLESLTAPQLIETPPRYWRLGKISLVNQNCFHWLEDQDQNSIHAIVTDPPYGLHEYTREQQRKLRNGQGGVWRIPPSFDGSTRSPLPRFTTLNDNQLQVLQLFFLEWGRLVLPRLVPGANVIVASNPLVSHIVSFALAAAGLERRGEIIRLVMTMRGGDRPKSAHEEFSQVSVMPRSMWEPWLVFRKPLEGRVQDNLRKWGVGGFRRPSADRPFGDVIRSSPTSSAERKLAPHPSLKPQAFMRELVRGVLPLGEGVVVDPFAGAGSTLAAAEHLGYRSVGIELDEHYYEMAMNSIPRLINLQTKMPSHSR